MISRALNSDNDIFVKAGSLSTVKDGAEVVQSVRTRLLFYFKEWFLDNKAGTPYFQEVFTKPANLANIESVLKRRILETPGVQTLTNFSMEYEGADNRLLKVEFGATTSFGEIIGDEVALNV